MEARKFCGLLNLGPFTGLESGKLGPCAAGVWFRAGLSTTRWNCVA